MAKLSGVLAKNAVPKNVRIVVSVSYRVSIHHKTDFYQLMIFIDTPPNVSRKLLQKTYRPMAKMNQKSMRYREDLNDTTL